MFRDGEGLLNCEDENVMAAEVKNLINENSDQCKGRGKRGQLESCGDYCFRERMLRDVIGKREEQRTGLQEFIRR